jgi:hypothetical protein
MVFLKLINLFSDSEAQFVHAVVPSYCEFLEFFAIVKLDLLSLLEVLGHQTGFDALLGMLSHHLNILKLRFCIHVEPLVCLGYSLVVKLVNQVSDVVYELFLLDHRLRRLLK